MSDLYEMLNDTKNLDETDVFAPLGAYEQKKMRKQAAKITSASPKPGMLAKTACTAAVLCILVLSVSPTVRAAVQEFYLSLNDALRINRDLSPYKDVIHSSVSDNGYTLTLNEVLLDGNNLSISTSLDFQGQPLDTSDALPANPFLSELKIGGTPASYAVSYISSGPSQTEGDTLELVQTYYLSETPDLSAALDFDLTYQVLTDIDTPAAEFTFRFQADGSALASSVRHYALQEVFTLPNGGTLTLTDAACNAAGTTVTGTLENVPADYEFYLYGYDQEYNYVSFFEQDVSGETIFLKSDGWDLAENPVLNLDVLYADTVNMDEGTVVSLGSEPGPIYLDGEEYENVAQTIGSFTLDLSAQE
ncbi:MAG: DUF4179 domain-containing protein [Eubacteriales bacterium]|nr:DUF4179 domain-containing protein [Eubacteriales bacterium]